MFHSQNENMLGFINENLALRQILFKYKKNSCLDWVLNLDLQFFILVCYYCIWYLDRSWVKIRLLFQGKQFFSWSTFKPYSKQEFFSLKNYNWDIHFSFIEIYVTQESMSSFSLHVFMYENNMLNTFHFYHLRII